MRTLAVNILEGLCRNGSLKDGRIIVMESQKQDLLELPELSWQTMDSLLLATGAMARGIDDPNWTKEFDDHISAMLKIALQGLSHPVVGIDGALILFGLRTKNTHTSTCREGFGQHHVGH